MICGDGSSGLPAHAPFDRILVTAGAQTIPNALIDQLAIGGILVIPVGDENSQEMVRIEKTGPKSISKGTYGNFRFVKLVGKEGWK